MTKCSPLDYRSTTDHHRPELTTFISDRSSLFNADQLNWGSLSSGQPLLPLTSSFSVITDQGLGLTVDVPSPQPGITPPLVFQTLPDNIPTNFAAGDFVLFTGLQPGPPPAIGNPGPLTITFDRPIFGIGTQLAVDDTSNFTASISAFDRTGKLLGTFTTDGTASTSLDNSAVFLGVLSKAPNIAKVVFSISEPNRGFGINELNIVGRDFKSYKW